MGKLKSILIIDDEVDILTTLSFFFKREGIEVSSAENGLLGLENLKNCVNPPNLILLDMNMPELNAKEFLERRRILDIHPLVPVVLLSAEIFDVSDCNVIGYVPKPFEISGLLEKIKLFYSVNYYKKKD